MKPGVIGTALVVVLGAAGTGALVVKDQGALAKAAEAASDGESKLAAGDLAGARKAFLESRRAAGGVTSLTLQGDPAAAVANRAREGLRTVMALEAAAADPLSALRQAGGREGLPPDAVDVLGQARASLLLDAALELEHHEAVDQAETLYAEAIKVAKSSGSPRLAEATLGQRRLSVLTNLRDASRALAADRSSDAGRLAEAAQEALEQNTSPFANPKRVAALKARLSKILAQVDSDLALSAYAKTIAEVYRKVDSEDLGTLYPVVKALTPPVLAKGHPQEKAHATRLAALERQRARVLSVAETFRGMVLARRAKGVTVFVGRTEVTNAEFAAFVAAGGYAKEDLWSSAARSRLANFVDRTNEPGPKYWSDGAPPKGREQHPVRGISYFEAEAYAKWRGQRLPTTSEWRAAAAPRKSLYPWGSSWQDGMANVRTGTKRGSARPVGSYPRGAGPSGALDMIGNVRELVRLGGGKYAGQGGSFNDKPSSATANSRRSISATIRASDTGFRCAKELKWDR